MGSGLAYRRFFRGVGSMAVVAAALVLSACTTTGASFDASSLDLFVPGQTTLAQASALLKSEPDNVYRQLDGSAMARWAHHTSFVPDAVYFNRELMLRFGPDGTFEHIVNSRNVPQAHQAQPFGQPAPASP